jgi:indole-3-glycerol phosphate synthase
MDILEQIIAHKREEVAQQKELFPVKLLEKSIYFPSHTVSLTRYITRSDKSGIIAEIKRKSPSKGIINKHVNVESTSIGYMQAGASALSILTDEKFFGGSNKDLSTARKFNFCPILRKDFIVDEYQIVEAKSIGADAILLIAAALESHETAALAKMARSLGLEVLLEVHNQEELEAHINDDINIVGVNNRDLKTFGVYLETSLDLARHIPAQFVKISESGLSTPEAILQLKEAGFQGFLMGEYFMSHSRPEAACAEFIQKIKRLESKQQTQ